MLNADHASRFLARVELAELGLLFIAIVIISLIVSGIRKLSAWLSKKFPKKRMLVLAWVPIFNFLLYFGGIFTAFYIIFSPSREFLIAFTISLFVAIGFGIKDIAASIIAGVILLLDKPFQIGDRVTFQDAYGEIIEIGLRCVKLLTLDESVVTIPNQRFISDVVSSSSAGELGMMTTVDVNIPLEADLYKVKEILEEESKKSTHIKTREKTVIVGKEVLGVNGVVSFVMTVKCILKDSRLEKAFQTDFLMAVNKAFKMHHILV